MSSMNVYTGLWIDWSGGRLLGATITVAAARGAFVVAFIALFVQVASSHLWDLMSFAWHQYRAASQYQDGVYRQQQVILRNSSTPATTLWNCMKVFWAWRSHAENIFFRTLPLVVVASLYMVGAIVAGIFSSRMVSTSGIVVLAQGSSCGDWKDLRAISDLDRPSLLASIGFYGESQLSASTSYARSCYNNTTSSAACNVFATRQVPWQSDYNAICPFAPGTCIGSDTSALQLDTGQLDSHTVLGLNAAPKNRVTYRRVTTCAPLKTNDRITWQNASQSDNGSELSPDPFAVPRNSRYELFHYGNQVTPVRNWTYIADSLEANLSVSYDFVTAIYEPGFVVSFIPSPEFNRSDADVNLSFLSVNSVKFTEPVDDPVFSAHQPYFFPSADPNLTFYEPENKTYYTSDNLANVIGCTDQHQFCNPHLPPHIGCTPLAGLYEVGKSLDNMSTNPLQAATAALIFNILSFWQVGLFMLALRPADLLAQRELQAQGLFSLPLPNNQWTIELQAWHSTVMAFLQALMVGRAVGPTNPNDGKWIITPNDTVGHQLCHAQKIRISGDYANISTFGLVVTLALGLLIIVLNTSLGVIVGWMQQDRGNINQKRLEWICDEELQLQRVAYERSGMGTWEGISRFIPTTVHREQLRPLADAGIQPMWSRPPQGLPLATRLPLVHQPNPMPQGLNANATDQRASGLNSLSNQSTDVAAAVDVAQSAAPFLSVNLPSPTLGDLLAADNF